MDVNTILLLVFVFFAAVLGLIFYLRAQRMKESWKGKVTDKKVVTVVSQYSGNELPQDTYYLHIKTTDGNEKKVSVSKKLYESFNVGDSVDKKAGEYNPVKI